MKRRHIAVKNLLRRKSRAVFTAAGIIIGVATVVALISFINAMAEDINKKMEKYGANILVVPKTDHLTLSYGGFSLGGVSYDMNEIRQADLSKIETIKNYANVAAVGPMVLGRVVVSGQPILLMGVDFEAAPILKPWWKTNGTWPDKGQLIAGAEAARILGLKSGDSPLVDDTPLLVSGILAPTGSQDDQLLFTRLETAQALLSKEGRISMAEIAALCSACPIEEMVRQISEALPAAKVMAIQQVVKGRMKTLDQFRQFSWAVSMVIIFVGGLVVLVTFMGSVRERTREIGVFRAIGFRQKDVISIIFTEAGILSVLAGITGYLLGIITAAAGLYYYSGSASGLFPLNPVLGIGSIVMALVVGILAAAYPARIAARMDPNAALNTI